MDEDEAPRNVAAALQYIAQSLRKGSSKDLLNIADQVSEIALQLELLADRKSERPVDLLEDDPALVADTLAMLESFRHLRDPSLRRSIIAIMKALRPGSDTSFV